MDYDQMHVRLKVQWKLEKFEGEIVEGKKPVETLVGEDVIEATPAKKEDQNATD